MKRVLYVNGCSHSCGAEISKVFSERTTEDLEKSFGGIISKKFNLLHVNDALPGCSNKIICSTTIHHILKLLEDFKSSEIFVLIGWTHPLRSEVIYNETLYHFSGATNSFPHFKDYPSIVQDCYNNWVNITDLSNTIYNDFSLNYFSLVSFLNFYKIDYYFFNAVSPICRPEKNYLHKINQNETNYRLFDLIENDANYLEPYNRNLTYYNYLQYKGYDCKIDKRNHHFTEDAHIEWSNVLLDKINNKLCVQDS